MAFLPIMLRLLTMVYIIMVSILRKGCHSIYEESLSSPILLARHLFNQQPSSSGFCLPFLHAFTKAYQITQCSTSAYCSSPSKPLSPLPSALSNTAPGPSSPRPKSPVWADCTSLTLFSVSQRLCFTPILQQDWKGRGD